MGSGNHFYFDSHRLYHALSGSVFLRWYWRRSYNFCPKNVQCFRRLLRTRYLSHLLHIIQWSDQQLRGDWPEVNSDQLRQILVHNWCHLYLPVRTTPRKRRKLQSVSKSGSFDQTYPSLKNGPTCQSLQVHEAKGRRWEPNVGNYEDQQWNWTSYQNCSLFHFFHAYLCVHVHCNCRFRRWLQKVNLDFSRLLRSRQCRNLCTIGLLYCDNCCHSGLRRHLRWNEWRENLLHRPHDGGRRSIHLYQWCPEFYTFKLRYQLGSLATEAAVLPATKNQVQHQCRLDKRNQNGLELWCLEEFARLRGVHQKFARASADGRHDGDPQGTILEVPSFFTDRQQKLYGLDWLLVKARNSYWRPKSLPGVGHDCQFLLHVKGSRCLRNPQARWYDVRDNRPREIVKPNQLRKSRHANLFVVLRLWGYNLQPH